MKENQTPKEYVEAVEKELAELLEQNKYKAIPFPKKNNNKENDEKKLKRYYRIIISILYKQLCLNSESDERYYGIIEYIIEELGKNINENNLTQAYILFVSYRKNILEEMTKYFKKTRENYILKKMSLKRINEKNNIKVKIEINPFLFCESFDYYCNPLTEEEQIIGEILEMKNQITKENVTQDLLIEMIKKYKGEKFNEVLMFIICNVYQNALGNDNQKLIRLTKYCIENPKITNKTILDYFMDREGNNIFITKELENIIQSFLYYNESIKEGDLKYLGKQPSREYVKRRLKKPD